MISFRPFTIQSWQTGSDECFNRVPHIVKFPTFDSSHQPLPINLFIFPFSSHTDYLPTLLEPSLSSFNYLRDSPPGLTLHHSWCIWSRWLPWFYWTLHSTLQYRICGDTINTKFVLTVFVLVNAVLVMARPRRPSSCARFIVTCESSDLLWLLVISLCFSLSFTDIFIALSLFSHHQLVDIFKIVQKRIMFKPL